MCPYFPVCVLNAIFLVDLSVRFIWWNPFLKSNVVKIWFLNDILELLLPYPVLYISYVVIVACEAASVIVLLMISIIIVLNVHFRLVVDIISY